MGASCSACEPDFQDERYNASRVRNISQRNNLDSRKKTLGKRATRRSESLYEARSSTFYSDLETRSFEKLPIEGSQSPRNHQRVRFKADADTHDDFIVHALLRIGDKVQLTNVTDVLEGKIGRIVGPFSHYQNRWEVSLDPSLQPIYVQPRNLRKLPIKQKYEEVPMDLIIASLPSTDSEKHAAMRNELFDFINTGRESLRISIEAIHIGLISVYGLHGFNFLPHLNLAFKALWKNRLCEEHFIDFDLFQCLLLALKRALILRSIFYRYRDNEYFEYLDFRRSLETLLEWNIKIDDCKAKYDYLEEAYYFTFDTFCTWAISESIKCFGVSSPNGVPKKESPANLQAALDFSSSHTGSFNVNIDDSSFREP